MTAPQNTNKNKYYYLQKAKNSFKARFNLLLFHRTINGMIGEITEDDLDSFEIDNPQNSLDEYINVYWQQEENKKYEIRGKVIEDIYEAMKDWQNDHKKEIDHLRNHYIDVTYKRVFPYENFVEFLKQDDQCDYCHITKKKINDLIAQKKLNKKHITRGWSLEIDRKEPNLEYTEENCVWCCYWCNNAKTDEFTYNEFKKVGSVIETIWNDRLKSKS